MSDLAREIADLEAKIRLASAPTQTSPASTWWSVQDAMTISAATLLFGLIALLVVAWSMRRERDSDAILRALGTIVVVFSALFLVVAGYSDSQVAPAFGLLGTVAGYLFGKSVSLPASPPAGEGRGGSPAASGGALMPPAGRMSD